MDRTINTAILWKAPNIQKNSLEWVFTFNWWSLDDWHNVRVIQSNHDDLWTVQFDTYDTPLQDGWWVLGKYYRQKQIQFVLSVNGDTSAWLNALIDEIKYQTSKTEWILRITINWMVREWTATCTSLKFNRQNYNVNWCGNVVLTFTCVNPHSHLEEPESESIISQTGTYQWNIIYSWRAETFPKLYLTMDSWSATWMSFTLNWYTIAITTSLSASDIILFDWDSKKVTVNWTEVAYTWPFVPLSYWENVYSVTNAWTYTWSLSYYVKYL